MGAGTGQNELTDVVLCYQAMGIPLDASPEAIDRKCQSLANEYKRKMASADPATRQEIKESMELLIGMHEKIRGSITYRAVEKEVEKKSQAARAAIKPVHDVVAQRSLMMQCPRCNGAVVKGSESCPICKAPIYSGVDKLTKTLITPGRLVLLIVVLAAAALATTFLVSPEIFTGTPAGVQQKAK